MFSRDYPVFFAYKGTTFFRNNADSLYKSECEMDLTLKVKI